MGKPKDTWPPLTDSRCQAINGYGASCTHTVPRSSILCSGQMRGFCGFHMNMSFTLAIILKSVAQDLRDDKQPGLADAMLKKYGVQPGGRESEEEGLPEYYDPPGDDDIDPYDPPDDYDHAVPGCSNCHSAMIFDSAGIEGTLYRCTGCPARVRVQRSS